MGLFKSTITLYDDQGNKTEFAMSKDNLFEYLKFLDSIFFKARLVDVQNAIEYNVTPDGKVAPTETCCFSVWGKESVCTNCTSMKALENKCQCTKHESIGSVKFHVTSKYVEFNGDPYVLEIVVKETHEVKD